MRTRTTMTTPERPRASPSAATGASNLKLYLIALFATTSWWPGGISVFEGTHESTATCRSIPRRHPRPWHASFSWRKRIGAKAWRKLHYASFVAFAAAALHGVLAGSDSSAAGMNALYVSSVTVVGALVSFRALNRSGRVQLAGRSLETGRARIGRERPRTPSPRRRRRSPRAARDEPSECLDILGAP